MAGEARRTRAGGIEVYLTYYEHHTGGEVCAGQEGEKWADHEDEVIDWGLNRLCASMPVGEPSIKPQEEEPIVQDTAWVVFVRYTTGCTFGRITGCGHVVAVVASKWRAEDIASQVRDGRYRGYKPWEGYFESFELCDIKEMVVER